MQTATSGSWVARVSRIAAVIGVLLIPIATTAQGAAGSSAEARIPALLQAFLEDLPHYNSMRVVGPKTSAALNTAIKFLNEKRSGDARAAIGALTLDALSPYERAMTEHVLFRIAYDEQKYAEARQHVQNAINSRGLTLREITLAQQWIEQIDAAIAAAPAA